MNRAKTVPCSMSLIGSSRQQRKTSHLEEGLPEILAEAHTRFSESIFVLLAQLRIELPCFPIRFVEDHRP